MSMAAAVGVAPLAQLADGPSLPRLSQSLPSVSLSEQPEPEPRLQMQVSPDHYSEEGGIPVFKPSWDQFKHFNAFMSAVDSYGLASGLVKIIPPPEYLSVARLDNSLLASTLVKTPITQNMSGFGLPSGYYRQMNFESRRSYSVQEWFDLANAPLHRPPAFGENGRVLAPTNQDLHGDPKRKKRKTTAHNFKERSVTGTPGLADSTTEANSSCNNNPSAETEMEDGLVTREDGLVTREGYLVSQEDGFLTPGTTTPPTIPSNLVVKSESISDLSIEHLGDPSLNQAAGAATPSLAPAPKPKRKRLPPPPPQPITFDLSQVSKGPFDDPNYCAELERFYWRNITYSSPMYGADMPGTLFEDNEENEWNPKHLDNLLTRIKVEVPGVNTPYLYFGMWKATFAWHVEDMDLYSINYVHFGAPKQWYVVPPAHSQRFERIASGIFIDESNKCSQFLRHKGYMISPTVLKRYGIPVHRIVQRAGEFMVTYPYGYHAGYNMGFNCAESVNFALDSWIEIGKRARYCECIGDSVKVDVRRWFCEGGIGVEVQEEQEEEPKVLKKLTPKVEKKKDGTAAPTVPRKRKVGGGDSVGKRSMVGVHGVQDVLPVVKKKAAASALPAEKVYRLIPDGPKCALCPYTGGSDLLPTDVQGGPLAWAHRRCAIFVPETYLGPDSNMPTREMIFGVSNIEKARWALKCDVCKLGSKAKNSPGAPIQCAKGKCVRSFHVSCADTAGILMIEPNESNVVAMCFCKQHDGRHKEEKKKMKAEETLGRIAVGCIVIAKIEGSFYEGTIREVVSARQSCLVELFDGASKEISVVNLRVIDTGDQPLSEPSPTVSIQNGASFQPALPPITTLLHRPTSTNPYSIPRPVGSFSKVRQFEPPATERARTNSTQRPQMQPSLHGQMPLQMGFANDLGVKMHSTVPSPAQMGPQTVPMNGVRTVQMPAQMQRKMQVVVPPQGGVQGWIPGGGQQAWIGDLNLPAGVNQQQQRLSEFGMGGGLGQWIVDGSGSAGGYGGKQQWNGGGNTIPGHTWQRQQ